MHHESESGPRPEWEPDGKVHILGKKIESFWPFLDGLDIIKCSITCNANATFGWVVVIHTQQPRYAVLCSTDADLEPLRLYRFDKARFHMEFLCCDAKQLTGLSDCQARSKAKLAFHFHASLSAVNLAKLEACQQRGDPDEPMAMASLKRRAFNQHLLDRICEHLATGQNLEKSSPAYEALCNYGVITNEAA